MMAHQQCLEDAEVFMRVQKYDP